MYDDIIDLAMDQQLLSEIHSSQSNYHKLPLWKEIHAKTDEEIEELRMELESSKQLTFSKIFNEPIGYHFIKTYLDTQFSVDKATFIKDVKVYKSVNDRNARLEIAEQIYASYIGPKSHQRTKGESCLHILDRNSPSKQNKVSSQKNEKSAVSADIKESKQDSNDLKEKLTTVPSQSNDADPALTRLSTAFMSNESNAIGSYGKAVKKLERELQTRELLNLKSFDRIVEEILDDLKLDVFPRFLLSNMFQMYLRCKSFESKHISISSFHPMRMLGRGAFGSVNACKKKDTGKLYAMKQIDKRRVQATDSVQSLIAERNYLSIMESRFVTALKYAFVDDDRLYLIMDLMTGGDLKYHLNHDGVFEETRARYYAGQILLGLEHIHSKGVIYRDLKLENILVDDQGQCKISDLGLAVNMNDGLVRGYAGTPGYTAPEVVLTQYYAQQVDFFSFGVVIYRCLCGKKPFAHKRTNDVRKDPNQNERIRKTSIELDRNVVEMLPPFDSHRFTSEAKCLIKGLLHKNPTQRLGLNGYTEIKDHPWFDCLDFGLLETGYLKAPFIPSCDEIHAEQQQYIGRPPDDDKYSKIKLTEEFEESLKIFPFVSTRDIQNELVAVLEKVANDRKKSVGTDNLTIEELYAFPSPHIANAHHHCLGGCVLI